MIIYCAFIVIIFCLSFMRKVIITNIMNELIDINVGICFLNPLSLINKGVIIPSAMKLINTTPTYSKYITGVDCHDKL
ncbi:hypothetical protein L0P56_05995, partial [Anaerosalibacter bizertensis]|nr:hypothetical protein [Anaerosalibacter bizertensis]